MVNWQFLLRVWMRTRRQKSVRRLRGNVVWDGDINASRIGRVTTD